MTRHRRVARRRPATRPPLLHVLMVIGFAFVASLLMILSAVAEPAHRQAPGKGITPEPQAERVLWRDSFAVLARRADLGDAEAARLALQMRALGPRVYGVHFEASAEQLERWRQAVQHEPQGAATVG